MKFESHLVIQTAWLWLSRPYKQKSTSIQFQLYSYNSFIGCLSVHEIRPPHELLMRVFSERDTFMSRVEWGKVRLTWLILETRPISPQGMLAAINLESKRGRGRTELQKPIWFELKLTCYIEKIQTRPHSIVAQMILFKTRWYWGWPLESLRSEGQRGFSSASLSSR